MAVKSEPTKY